MQAVSTLLGVHAGLALLFGVSAFTQMLPASSSRTIVGTVEAISDNHLTVSSGNNKFKLTVDTNSKISRDRVFGALSSVQSGDTLVARCRLESSGTLLVESMWLNITTVFGNISAVTENGIEIFTNPNADPYSAYKRHYKTVNIDSTTTFDSSARRDLRVGRAVQVVGTNMTNEVIQASKIIVFESKRPTALRDGIIFSPDGTIKQ